MAKIKYVDLTLFGHVPFTYGELSSLMEGYSAPKNKAQEMERNGDMVRLKKGLYVVAPTSNGLAANHLYGPSYVSLQTALRLYGLIPEHVYSTTSVTTLRTSEFTNPLGRFTYTHVSPRYYPIGITMRQEEGLSYLIATPEKALCDLIVTTSRLNLRSLKELIFFLEEDIRFDTDCLKDLNPAIVQSCAQTGKKSHTLLNLVKLIQP